MTQEALKQDAKEIRAWFFDDYLPTWIKAGAESGSVALPVDQLAWRRNGCQFLKRDGSFFLPTHRTGRQKTARYRPFIRLIATERLMT